jgi:hypothetical protein
MKSVRTYVLLATHLSAGLGVCTLARAEDEGAAPVSANTAPAVPLEPVSSSESSVPKTRKDTKHRKVTRGENRENEGTTAPERFEGNTILKSQYFLNGQSLEVDPD